MADNAQTTDPLAAKNNDENQETGDWQVPWDAEEVLPDTVRDPGKGNNGGAPLWQGSQASDF